MLPVTDSLKTLTSQTNENRTSVKSKSQKIFFVRRLTNLQRCSVFFNDLSRSENKTVNGQYLCNVCGSGFNTDSDLEIHVNDHAKDDPYSCGLCKMPFCELSDLRRHVQFHNGKKHFECEIVDLLISLGTWSYLKIECFREGTEEHEQIFLHNLEKSVVNIPDTSFSCDDEPFIAEVFEDNVGLRADEEECISDADTEKELPENTVVAAAAVDQGETAAVPAVEDNNDAEEDLSEVFNESQDPGDVDYVEPPSSGEIRSLQCKTCLKVFKHLKAFRRHEDYNKEMGENKCDICNKIFHRRPYKDHMKIHYGEAFDYKTGQLDSSVSVGKLDEAVNNKKQCKICLKVFPHLKAFMKHNVYHREMGENKCNICDKTFHRRPYKEHMKAHYEEAYNYETGELDSSVDTIKLKEAINNIKSPLSCHLCKIVFEDLEELKKHSQTHAKERPHICDVCGRCFATRVNLNVHVKDHKKEKKAICEICGRRFLKPSILARHRLTHTNIRPFKCEICEASFRRPISLRLHLKKHDISGVFKCSVCDLSFDEFIDYTEHKKTHVNTDHICEVCGKSFSQRSYLIKHKETHEAIIETQCNICEKKLQTRMGLKHHLALHFKSCSFQCDLCGHSFKNLSGLKVHRQRHAGEKPHKCRFCDRAFVLATEVIIHERVHTGAKPYECKICYKAFATFETVKDHMQIHTDKRPHPCKICGKRFSFRKSMLQHIRIHTGEKPYKCLSCGSRFRTWMMLKEHFAKVHPEEGPLAPDSHGAQKNKKQDNKFYEVTLRRSKSDQNKSPQNNTKINTKEQPQKKNTQISDSSGEDTEPCNDDLEHSHGANRNKRQGNKLDEVTLKGAKSDQNKSPQTDTKINTKEQPRKKYSQISDSSGEDTDPCNAEIENTVNLADTAKAKTSGDYQLARSSLFNKEDTDNGEMEHAINSADTSKARTFGVVRQTRNSLINEQTECDNWVTRDYCCGVCLQKFKTREETIVHYSQHEGPGCLMTTRSTDLYSLF